MAFPYGEGHQTKEKKMTKEKVITSQDVVNADLLAVFAGVVNGSLVAELVAYEKGVSMLRGGLISVRGLKLTIKEAVIAGNLPTLRPSHSQDFLLSSVVRELKGGKEATLKDLMNATVQGRKWLKGADKVAEAIRAGQFASFADLVKATPKQSTERKETPKGIEAQISALLETMEAEDFDSVIIGIENAEKVVKQLGACIALSKQNRTPAHPAVRQKIPA
jgi:hypothetical protein